MLPENIKRDLKQKFTDELKGPVTILFFTSELAGESCADTRLLLRDITELTDKIELKTLNHVLDKAEAERYGITRIPALVPLSADGSDHGIRFFGMPGGYEFSSFIDALIRVSTGQTALSEQTRQRLAAIDVPIHIQVFVTPT